MRYLLLTLSLVVVFLLPSHSWSAVAYDATANGKTASAGTSLPTISHTFGSISNGAISISIAFSANTATGITVTVDGNAASLVTGSDPGAVETTRALTYCYASGSLTGAKNVAISWTGSMDAAAATVSVSGADQTTPCQNGTTATGGGGPTSSITVTSATGNLNVAVMSADSGSAPTAPTQTSVYADNVNFQVGIGVSRAAGAASVAHDWTTGSGWTASAIDFKAAAAGASVEGFQKRKIK